MILGLIGGAGWYVWHVKNIQTIEQAATPATQGTSEKVKEPASPSSEFLDSEVAKIEKVVGPDCSNEMRELNKRAWVIASSEFTYYKVGQQTNYQISNKVSSDYKFANILYGCGSQGSTYVVTKLNNEWKIVAQSATIWSKCEDIKGKNVPVEIMPQCYDETNKLVDVKNI